MSSPADTDRTAPDRSHITAALHGRAEERLAEPAAEGAPDSGAGRHNDAKEKELRQRAAQGQVNEVIEKGE